jgi:MoaA/NifB/PqqE/SkfB family radical SAM enzyme
MNMNTLAGPVPRAAAPPGGTRRKADSSLGVMADFGWRMLRSTDLRLIWKFAYNFGYKGMRSVEKFKARIKKGIHFPPFLYISITNGCNLRCQGCWVDVDKPARMIPFEELDRLVRNAKQHGNSFFGILGGEPFIHPDLVRLFRAHPDCYFQVFTNGQLITDEIAADLRRAGNATPLISVEGTATVSDERRGRKNVLSRTLAGLETSLRHRLITGVATSVCQSNYDDLVREEWIDRLIGMGVHYTWFHTYRPVGPVATPSLALRPEQVLALRRFVIDMRNRRPIGIIDAYYDDRGEALCPAATGISHHIGPFGDVEPCPIIQFAKESIRDNDGDLYKTMTESPLLRDFRKTAAKATRGCIVLERPDLLKEVVERHSCRDTTIRGSAMVELRGMTSRTSQHLPGQAVPEENWLYRFAKKHWFFGFGAYT